MQRLCKQLKALADPNRLKIATILAQGERCACELLEELHITQPTLSHHMQVLAKARLVQGRREGKWTHYTLQGDALHRLQSFFEQLQAAPTPANHQPTPTIL